MCCDVILCCYVRYVFDRIGGNLDMVLKVTSFQPTPHRQFFSLSLSHLIEHLLYMVHSPIPLFLYSSIPLFLSIFFFSIPLFFLSSALSLSLFLSTPQSSFQ